MSRIDQLLKFHEENPGDSFIRYALALEHIKTGDLDKALVYFEQLVAHDPDYVGTYYHLAKLYVKMGNRPAAANCYEQGIIIAKKVNDQHSLAELQNAATNFNMGLDDED